MVVRFLKHLRPKYIDKNAAGLTVTFGLGGLLTLLFIILTVSGIILMFFYIPTKNDAYTSVKKITDIIPFTGLLRDIHRISGELMIVAAFFHMVRVVLVKPFDNKYRIYNWITGVLLFILIFPFNFTGYLLPWDNISYWGATIVLNLINSIPLAGEKFRLVIAGSSNIPNTATLIRFYTYHVVLLPMIFIFLMMNHFYLVRAAGGVKVTGVAKKERINSGELFKIEVIYALIAIILIIALCHFFYNAPLVENANKGLIPSVVKAPWYFAGIQFLLTYIPPLTAGVVIPIFYIIFMLFFYKIGKISIFLIIHILFIVFTILELYVK